MSKTDYSGAMLSSKDFYRRKMEHILKDRPPGDRLTRGQALAQLIQRERGGYNGEFCELSGPVNSHRDLVMKAVCLGKPANLDEYPDLKGIEVKGKDGKHDVFRTTVQLGKMLRPEQKEYSEAILTAATNLYVNRHEGDKVWVPREVLQMLVAIKRPLDAYSGKDVTICAESIVAQSLKRFYPEGGYVSRVPTILAADDKLIRHQLKEYQGSLLDSAWGDSVAPVRRLVSFLSHFLTFFRLVGGKAAVSRAEAALSDACSFLDQELAAVSKALTLRESEVKARKRLHDITGEFTPLAAMIPVGASQRKVTGLAVCGDWLVDDGFLYVRKVVVNMARVKLDKEHPAGVLAELAVEMVSVEHAVDAFPVVYKTDRYDKRVYLMPEGEEVQAPAYNFLPDAFQKVFALDGRAKVRLTRFTDGCAAVFMNRKNELLAIAFGRVHPKFAERGEVVNLKRLKNHYRIGA